MDKLELKSTNRRSDEEAVCCWAYLLSEGVEKLGGLSFSEVMRGQFVPGLSVPVSVSVPVSASVSVSVSILLQPIQRVQHVAGGSQFLQQTLAVWVMAQRLTD